MDQQDLKSKYEQQNPTEESRLVRNAMQAQYDRILGKKHSKVSVLINGRTGEKFYTIER